MDRRISTFFIAFLCFLFCATEGTGREAVPAVTMQQLQQVPAERRDQVPEFAAPAPQQLNGRRGPAVSFVPERTAGYAVAHTGFGLYRSTVLPGYATQAACPAAEALAVFLQGLLYPKHSFW